MEEHLLRLRTSAVSQYRGWAGRQRHQSPPAHEGWEGMKGDIPRGRRGPYVPHHGAGACRAATEGRSGTPRRLRFRSASGEGRIHLLPHMSPTAGAAPEQPVWRFMGWQRPIQVADGIVPLARRGRSPLQAAREGHDVLDALRRRHGSQTEVRSEAERQRLHRDGRRERPSQRSGRNAWIRVPLGITVVEHDGHVDVNTLGKRLSSTTMDSTTMRETLGTGGYSRSVSRETASASGKVPRSTAYVDAVHLPFATTRSQR